jgi:hypothetical protein
MGTVALSRLLEPFGNLSMMGILWESIAASPAYEVFVGLAEVTAGVLLMIPATAQLGALMGLMDAIAVFVLNMTYDVDVKLFSFHLVVISIVLTLPNARRLFDLFVLHRPSAIPPEPTVGRTARGRRVSVAAQLVFLVYMFGLSAHFARQQWYVYGGGAPRSPLYGIWDVTAMTVDGEVRPPLLTDTTRWRRVVFQWPGGVTFQRLNDDFRGFYAKIDTVAKTIVLTSPDSVQAKLPFTFQRVGREQLVLDGTMYGRTVHMELARRDLNSFPQRSRRFHWISEVADQR